MTASPNDTIVFVTGKLAEPALRRMLQELEPKLQCQCHVIVMPITVAALLTITWIARRIQIPEGTRRVILPGLCQGDVTELQQLLDVSVELGPKDLRDLPEFFGQDAKPRIGYGEYTIEIVAEINHAPQLGLAAILEKAEHYRRSGADVIDLGCDPNGTWADIGLTVTAMKDRGLRVSVDSFNPAEVLTAVQAGAELVLSVNSTNRHFVPDWLQVNPHIEVVAIPDTPTDLVSLDATVTQLRQCQAKFRIDPVLEPIGFGFAASLGRYLECRKRYPDLEILMGVGNLTELTDVDSAGVNVLLAGFCQELGIRSVLATEVINWGQSAVREFDVARRLVHYAVKNQVLPKRLETNLVLLRDPKVYPQGPDALEELAQSITDRNYRIFAERGEIHVMNGDIYIHGNDPYTLFQELARCDPKLDPSHSFYLGYEFAKAVTALTLGKQYTQDQALRWGFLTVPEKSHRS